MSLYGLDEQTMVEAREIGRKMARWFVMDIQEKQPQILHNIFLRRMMELDGGRTMMMRKEESESGREKESAVE